MSKVPPLRVGHVRCRIDARNYAPWLVGHPSDTSVSESGPLGVCCHAISGPLQCVDAFLSHTMYQLDGFRTSTALQNCQLVVLRSNSER